MKRTLRWLGVPLFALLTAPAFAEDKKPTDKKETDHKLVKAGMVAGELVHIEPSKHSIRLKVAYQKINMGAYQGLIQAQAQLATARSLQQIQSIQRTIAGHQRNLYTTAYQEIPIDTTETCVVRLPAPKSAFDDMGNVKKMSPKELAKLRGKDKMFDGEFSDLTTGQIVRITLVKNKTTPGPKGKDDLDENKPQASRIEVLSQPKPN